MYPRPRGRSRLGSTWDTTIGKWVPCAHLPTQTPIAKKTTRTFQVIVALPSSYASPQTSPTFTSSTNVSGTTKALDEEYARNEQRFFKESRRIQQEMRDKKEAQEAEEAREAEETRQQEAAVDAQHRMFMYPYDTAKKMYDDYNRFPDKRVYTYWMDSYLDVYEYPANPYNRELKPKVEVERLFVWKYGMRTCKMTHHDDPDTLEVGEWEYRDVMRWYKTYV